MKRLRAVSCIADMDIYFFFSVKRSFPLPRSGLGSVGGLFLWSSNCWRILISAGAWCVCLPNARLCLPSTSCTNNVLVAVAHRKHLWPQ